MLVIPRDLLDAVFLHGREAFPRECCGLLVGCAVDGRREVRRVERVTNRAPAEARDRYEIDPAERLRIDAAARAEGMILVGFYHSHPDHNAYFSRTDLERSEEYQLGQPWLAPTYSYLVVSIRDGRAAEARSFIVREGAAEEEAMEVLHA